MSAVNLGGCIHRVGFGISHCGEKKARGLKNSHPQTNQMVM